MSDRITALHAGCLLSAVGFMEQNEVKTRR